MTVTIAMALTLIMALIDISGLFELVFALGRYFFSGFLWGWGLGIISSLLWPAPPSVAVNVVRFVVASTFAVVSSLAWSLAVSLTSNLIMTMAMTLIRALDDIAGLVELDFA